MVNFSAPDGHDTGSKNAGMRALYLSQGVLADGQPYYAYLSVAAGDVARLQQAEAGGNFRLGDYGEILAGEIGVSEPDSAIRQKVEELFAQHSQPD